MPQPKATDHPNAARGRNTEHRQPQNSQNTIKVKRLALSARRLKTTKDTNNHYITNEDPLQHTHARTHVRTHARTHIHTQWEQQQTMNQLQQNHPLRTDSSRGYGRKVCNGA